VIPPHREGGQAQYIPRPVPSDERHRLAKLLDYVRAHPADEHTLASLARRAAMSPRTLQRQFRETVGLAPSEWLVRERVALAKDMLQSSRRALPHVAQAAGFGSQESFRRHFRRVAGVSPASYRRQFGRAGG
jgi:AraC family transcriptional activator FtrA